VDKSTHVPHQKECKLDDLKLDAWSVQAESPFTLSFFIARCSGKMSGRGITTFLPAGRPQLPDGWISIASIEESIAKVAAMSAKEVLPVRADRR
jgi:hypothetical protein